MVCPNCQSEQIIEVQDQHFCISCGQMVPDEVVAKAKSAEPKAGAKVQANGLPEGVKILPIGSSPAPVAPDEKPADAPAAQPKAKVAAAPKVDSIVPDAPNTESPKPENPKSAAEVKPAGETGLPAIIKHHSRMQLSSHEPAAEAAQAVEAAPAPETPAVTAVADAPASASATAPAASLLTAAKRRKPGRPKAGRLDVPRPVASTAPAGLPVAPSIGAGPPPPPPPTGPRRMSDIAPRRAGHPASHQPAHPATAKAQAGGKPETAATQTAENPAAARQHARARAHKVGVPPLHYAPIMAFSLRMRLHPRLVAVGMLGSLALGAASAYGAYVVLTGGVQALAEDIMVHPPKLIAGAALLAIMYYVGRSLGQTAITYGIAREADQRPVALNRQFGVAVNTFWRRLRLDATYGLGELALIAGAAVVFITGGDVWPMSSNLQLGLIFTVYLVILYLLTALALSKGLAGVALTLSSLKAGAAAKLGWRLFSHRIELIGPRFGAVLLEALLAVPLIALAVWFVISAPPEYHLAVTIAAGLLATLAGALTGVGTAAWWSMLYRQLILADRPADAASLLSSRQPEEARRGALAFIVALSTLAIAAILILPWIQLG